MKEENKHKSLSAEDLFKIIDSGMQEQAGMDDFEREALDGLQMIKDRGRLERINERIDEELREKKSKRGIVFWISAAASLVFVIGLVYMIAPQLKEAKNAEVAVAETKDAQAPAVNSDGKLSDTVVQEIVASGDSVSFVAEDKLADVDSKDIVAAKNKKPEFNGTGVVGNQLYRNEKTILSETQTLTQTYEVEELKKTQLDDYLVVSDNESRSYQKQALENEGSFKSADTSKIALNSFGYTTTTSNMGVMSPSTNATPYYSFTEQDKKKTETKSNDNSKDIQQSIQTVNRTDNNNNVNGNTSNTTVVNNGSANTAVSDSTAGFHNAMALNNKGKKKEGEAEKQVSYKQQKSVAQKADEYYSGNEIALNKESEMAGATLDEIELVETNKKGEEVEDSKSAKFTDASIPEYPGGVSAMQKFFRDNIKKQGDSKGQVIASFTINKDGSVSNAKIISGIAGCDACSAEVLRVIKMMPKWKPATASGKPINITYNLPVRF